MKDYKRKIFGFGILSLFLVMSVFEANILQLGQYNRKNDNEIDNIDETLINSTPLASSLSIANFTVNGTELYEDGVYYCFLGDNLEYKLITSTDVSEVNFIMNKTGYDFDIEILESPDTTTYPGWSYWTTVISIPETKKTGMYNGSILLNPGSGERIFYFNLSIMNPQPRIIRAAYSDENYDTGSFHSLFEGEEYVAYHFSEFNISAWVVNENGLDKIDSVQLIYENGYRDQYHTINLAAVGNPILIGGYEAQQYSLDSNLVFSISNENLHTMSNWSKGEIFSFSLIVTDEGDIESEDIQSYDFFWEILIGNRPPEITEFDVDIHGLTEANIMDANMLNFTISANVSDVETDALFGNELYNISQTFTPVSARNLSSGVESNTYDVLNLRNRDNLYHDVSFSGANQYYGFNYSFGLGYDFSYDELYKDWYMKLVFNTIAQSNVDLVLQFYNYETQTWDPITGTDLNNIPQDEETVFIFKSENSSISDEDMGKYIKLVAGNRILRARLSSVGDGGEIRINQIQLGFKINRRIGASDMILNIYRPENPDPIRINMVNLYNNTENKWQLTYRHNFNSSSSLHLIGAWSFVLKVYDFGITDVALISVNETDGINALSQFSGYSESNKQRSYAVISEVKNIGINEDDILTLNEVTMSNETPDGSSDETIFVKLNDNDANNPSMRFNNTYHPVYSDTRQHYEIYIQNGDGWDEVNGYTIDTLSVESGKSVRVDQSSLVLNLSSTSQNKTHPTFMEDANDMPYRFSINEEGSIANNGMYYPDGFTNNSFGIVLGFNIDWKYWLSPQNISGIWFETKINYNNSVKLMNRYPQDTYVQFWDFKNDEWITPMEAFGEPYKWWSDNPVAGDGDIIKPDDSTIADEIWKSTRWNQTNKIEDCILRAQNNLMYVRILEKNLALDGDLLSPEDQQSMNFSIDIARLYVEYENYYQANLSIYDSVTENEVIYPMVEHSSTATERVWRLDLPLSQLSARNYHFSIWAQNGNSSIWIDNGKMQGFRSWNDNLYKWYPFYQQNKVLNDSFSFEVTPGSIIYDNLAYSEQLNFHRNMDELEFSGKIDYKYALDDIIFEAQFRHWSADSNQDDWAIFSGFNKDLEGDFVLEFDNSTSPQEWNLSLFFMHENLGFRWTSGVWYYRVIGRTNETLINATDWGVFRMHNFQPKDIVIKGMESGDYFRVRDEVNYEISFVDLEGDNLASVANWDASQYYDIEIRINVQNRDNNLEWERWNTQTQSSYFAKVEQEFRYNFTGDFTFGREIQIGTYNEVFITVKDLMEEWPQVGTLKITDRDFEVLNNPPMVSMALTSNTTEELKMEDYHQIYRQNGLELEIVIFDYDDFGYNISQKYFNLTAIDNLGNVIQIDENQTIYRSDSYDNPDGLGYFSVWNYERFIWRNNKTGFWNFTANFQDPDGDTIEFPSNLTIEVLNNLPTLDNLQFERYDKDGKLIEIGYLTSHFSNLTNFGVYRANETLRVVADLHDIEDTYLEETDYSIKSVDFSLINNYGVHKGTEYTNEEYIFSLVQNGTHEVGFIPIYNEFYVNNFNDIQTDNIYSDDLLVVVDENGGTASVDNIKYDDTSFHNVSFINSNNPNYRYGGEYYLNFTSLDPLFELHAESFEFNISMIYKTDSRGTTSNGFDVFVYNYIEEEWVLLDGTLNSETWTTMNFTLNSEEIRSYLTEINGNSLRLKIESKGFNPFIERSVGLEIKQVYLSFFKLENRHFERWQMQYTFPNDVVPGDLSFNFIMVDNDDGVGQDSSNILNIYNRRPNFRDEGVQLEFNGEPVTKAQTIYEFRRIDRPYIDIFISASDFDSPDNLISSIKIGVFVKLPRDILDSSRYVRSGSSEWEFDIQDIMTEDEHTYRVRISLDDANRDPGNSYTKNIGLVEELEISFVTIVDKDFGLCNPADSRFAPVTTRNSLILDSPDSSYKFVFILVTDSVPPFNWALWGSLIGIGGAAFLVVFYRKFVSYRKYMDDY